MKILRNKRSIKICFAVNKQRFSLAPVRLGRWGNPADMARAQEIADLIVSDIKAHEFDSTLSRYKPKQLYLGDRDKTDLKFLWQRYASFKKSSVAQSTWDIDFKRRMNGFFKQVPTTKLGDALIISEWLRANKPPTQAQKILTNIKGCCTWAVDAGLIDKNPFAGNLGKIKKPRRNPQQSIKPFLPQEKDKIIAAFSASETYHHYSYLVRFLFATGCRPSEAIALTWNDVQAERLTFSRTYINGSLRQGLKTQTERTIRLNQTIKDVLKEVREYRATTPDLKDINLVFPSITGNYIIWHNFATRAWKSVLKSLPGISYRNPYQCRHTFITLALKNNVFLPDVAAFCGNSSKIIWERYAGFTQEFVMPDF